MRNPLRPLLQPLAPPAIESTTNVAPSPTAPRLKKLIGWLRAGYPGDAAPGGYSPLLALNGPVTLTAEQVLRAVNEIDCYPTSSTEIEVAITKATNRMPTPAQVDKVSRALKKPST